MGVDGTIDNSSGLIMAETISLEKIRQRKSIAGAKRPSGQRCVGRSSPDSYVILLDEPEQTPPNPPKETKCLSIWYSSSH